MAVARPHRPTALLRVGLAALLLAGLSASAGGGRPVPTADAGVAPKCTYSDTLTRYRARSDWYRSLLDSRFRLSSTYAPTDLISASRSGASGSGSIRRFALADLKAMYAAARSAGAPFAIQSAYRSYATQVSTFNRWVQLDGYNVALLGSARPGHSEHQLGTTLDLKTPGGPAPWDVPDWATTRAGSWIAKNSWRYGFVVSYPKNRTASTCYQYEPWHVRYYGRIIAGKIHRSGLTAREWLYTKGATTTWIGGGPLPTPVPTPTPSPTASPTPTPVPTADPPDAPSALPSDEPSPSADASPSVDPSPSVSPSPAGEPSPAG